MKLDRQAALVALLEASGNLDRAATVASIVREECALRWIPAHHRTTLSNALYRKHERYLADSAHTRSGLFAFEREAISRYFPAAPARLLVGAAGSGREVLALKQMGFSIAAYYDPSEDLLSRLRSQLPESPTTGPSWVASHEQLTEPIPGALFDGCVIGWGSYTHVLGRDARVQLLTTLRGSSPSGPVLLSFLARGSSTDSPNAQQFRNTCRSLLDRLHRTNTPEEGDRYLQGTGFIHLFTRAEIEDEAIASGYVVAHYADAGTYPHAVLRPRPA